jgi:predicted nucleic acid-binding protein
MNQLVARFRWKEFDQVVWESAAQGWADARQRGESPADADLLIAYHAHRFAAIVVTDNLKHFQRFPVQVENWRAPDA